MILKNLFNLLDSNENNYDKIYQINGWVRTTRTSSSSFGFSNINDGSNPEGLQLVISTDFINLEQFERFFKYVKVGANIKCIGNIIKSPAKGQKCEMQVREFYIIGNVDDSYPLSKSKMNLDTLRTHIHLRGRTNIFGSVFRIRSSLMKILHDYFHEKDFLHLDPNIITINECEGGAGVFQLTEKDITSPDNLVYDNSNNKYDWTTDHFGRPAYLTVSSQLQLETLACSLGNVYTFNKSFRSEHSCTTKHASEFTHLEIEIINNTFDDLMNYGENMIKYAINRILLERKSDFENLDKFISKGIIQRLNNFKNKVFIKIKYSDAIDLINNDIQNNKKLKLNKITFGDDLGTEHENYLTQKYDTAVFVTHWPIEIKSFYMKQCHDGTCESFDLIIPYGIGELIGASQREEDYDKLSNMMDLKGINKDDLQFYLDLRRYGTCHHGGFGLGFDRLLMLITGMQNIKDVIPFPVNYKNCKY